MSPQALSSHVLSFFPSLWCEVFCTWNLKKKWFQQRNITRMQIENMAENLISHLPSIFPLNYRITLLFRCIFGQYSNLIFTSPLFTLKGETLLGKNTLSKGHWEGGTDRFILSWIQVFQNFWWYHTLTQQTPGVRELSSLSSTENRLPRRQPARPPQGSAHKTELTFQPSFLRLAYCSSWGWKWSTLTD